MAGIGKEIQFLVWILKPKNLVPEHSNHRENLLIKGAFLQHFYIKVISRIFQKIYVMQTFVIGILLACRMYFDEKSQSNQLQ